MSWMVFKYIKRWQWDSFCESLLSFKHLIKPIYKISTHKTCRCDKCCCCCQFLLNCLVHNLCCLHLDSWIISCKKLTTENPLHEKWLLWLLTILVHTLQTTISIFTESNWESIRWGLKLHQTYSDCKTFMLNHNFLTT